MTIAISATDRLLDPQALSDVGVGLAVSICASLINLAVGGLLVRAGQQHRSIALEADGRHLLTDVWTSVGVVVGVAAVAITGWERLDPIVALAVAANIVVTGLTLVRRSAGGLMDRAIDETAQKQVEEVLASFRSHEVHFHALRTRQAGRRAFISMHVLVPGTWTIQQGHDLAEAVEAALREKLPYTTVFTISSQPRTRDRSLTRRSTVAARARHRKPSAPSPASCSVLIVRHALHPVRDEDAIPG